MVQEQAKPEEAIFKAAIQLEDPGARQAYVLQACGGDRRLLADVQTLLQYHSSTSFLDAPVFDPEAHLDEPVVTEGPGTIIGRYKLLEKIGEGGMAVVYMAEQTEPIRRKVALKIIKLGMDTRQVIARFEAERQALALMDYPSIAKVLDAGATETGRPYFVMELVQGVSITEYCDKNSLTTKDRLALFLQVCHAVQHAHQKGIIHRDIKPSNVMVTRHDGQPIPKVIDFGIAKATNQKLTEKTLFTRYAHLIGTPAYMSPEQAELSDLDIDTRSDIYSLGVLLYELLTGTTPFSEEELRKAGYAEMQRVIREQEPVKPSTKLSTLGDTLTDIAKCHGSTPDLLRKAVRGDLDWIVMKSLEKDRTRRYETASGLAEDVRRHLEHEPILARGPGAAYRLRKFLRRHQVQVLAILAVVLVAGAAAGVLSLWNQDRRQLAEAEGLRHRGTLSQAQGQYAGGDRDAALETIRPILDSRHVGPEAQLLQAGILVDSRRFDEATAILNTLLDGRQEIAGAAHALLARILWESGDLDAEKLKQIEEHHQKAEALLPETAEAYFSRAMTALTVKDQLAALNKALQLKPDHYESLRLRAFTYYASRKYQYLKDDAVLMAYLRPRDPSGYFLRAVAWRELGRYKEAIVDYDRAILRATEGSPQHLDLSIQHCETFLRMGDYRRAVAEAQECLRFFPDAPIFRYYTFCALTALGDYDGAATLFRLIVRAGSEARSSFENWCAKYVFDALAAGRSWYPPDRKPGGAAFLPMVEAEETYRALSAKARRVTTDGFTARWSPDGKKLAFSMGVVGYSGVALFDSATKETDLLIAPGKDPAWSPDGKYIAFARDRQTLRLEELAVTDRESEYSLETDHEVWLMKADGTQPRLLARGNWPCWSPDSACVYYYLRADQSLYSISLTDPHADPKRIVTCSSSFPALSPDGQQVAYVESGSLKVKDVASQTSVAEWKVPFTGSWGLVAWSPRGDELCLRGNRGPEKRAGLWIYRFDRCEPVKILDGQVDVGSWSLEGTKLAFTLGMPFFEVWTADVDPKVSLVETLSPAQTMDEHSQELIALRTRRITADPADPDGYLHRADHYRSLQEDTKLRADARRYWAALHPGWPAGFRFRGPWSIMHTLNGPFDYQLVVFVERHEDGMQLLRVAFGQKGRCEMKLFEIPMVVTSLAGLCLLGGLNAPAARADFTFGERVNLGATVNSAQGEGIPILSRDGLELYFASKRPGGYGDWDIWVSKRATLEAPWGPPVNLGQGINTASLDCPTSISSDGLTLYLFASMGKYYDIFTTTRPAKDAPWGPRVDLGSVVNSGNTNGGAIISPDDLELFFFSTRSDGLGNLDIYVSTRATSTSPWQPPVSLGPVVNTSGNESPGPMSPDGLVMFMGAENRAGGYGGWDTWIIRRPSKDAPWSEPVNLGPSFNTPGGEYLFSLSPDGQWAYGQEYVGVPVGNLWMVPILPTVDFDASGMVDFRDLVILIENWGTSETLCDIGPFAWGDGRVDIEDLKVFMTYYEKANPLAQGDGTTLLDFVPTEGSPEGVAVDTAGNVYISVSAATDQVWKFSPAGVKSVLADLGAPGGGALGLATDAAGNVYMCRASVTNAGVFLPSHGVYRISPDGAVSLLPGTEQIVFPNAVALDEQETLYITEMFSGDFASGAFGPGGLWRLPKGGTAELWVRHELLTGLAPSLFPFPVGANGVAFYGGALYVANPDKALIVRVPVQPDGSAGQPEMWKNIEDVPESFLHGSPVFPVMIDGLTFDPDGNAYVTAISRNAIVRIDADDRSQQTVAVYPQVPLDAPANVAFGTDKSPGDSLFITNTGMCKALIPDMPWPGPGLVKISILGSQGTN